MLPISNIAVQELHLGLHCSATEVTTLWLKQPFHFYSVMNIPKHMQLCSRDGFILTMLKLYLHGYP